MIIRFGILIQEWSPKPGGSTNYVEELLTHYAIHQTGLFSYDGSRLHQMNVMTARVPMSHGDTAVGSFKNHSEVTSSVKPDSLHGENKNQCYVTDVNVTSYEASNYFDAVVNEKKKHTKADILCSSEMDCSTDVAYNWAETKETVFDSSHLSSGHRTYVLLVAGEHDVILLFEVTEQKIAEIEEQFDNRDYTEDVSVVQPDYLFHIKDSYITGLCLSPDHR